MSFEANRSFVVLGAVTTGYIVEHPIINDANTGNVITDAIRNPHCEVVNGTAGLVLIAFDRAVTAPSGNGVQGPLNTATYSKSGPIAATPGDFDLAIASATGWSALDFVVPQGSRYMTVFTVAAGAVTVSYGKNDNG